MGNSTLTFYKLKESTFKKPNTKNWPQFSSEVTLHWAVFLWRSWTAPWIYSSVRHHLFSANAHLCGRGKQSGSVLGNVFVCTDVKKTLTRYSQHSRKLLFSECLFFCHVLLSYSGELLRAACCTLGFIKAREFLEYGLPSSGGRGRGGGEDSAPLVFPHFFARRDFIGTNMCYCV
jgi:hypothetical protein